MRNLLLLAGFLLLTLPRAAHADFVLGGSIGKGVQVSPAFAQEPTTLMIAPGWAFLNQMLRLELGVVASLPDIDRSGRFDMQLRPMLVVAPPIIPLHLRIITAGTDLLSKPQFNFGAAIGAGASLMGLGIFGELGVIPRFQTTGSTWSLEARAGVVYHFGD